jgi:histidyl-tRNA synthetase
MKLSIKFLMFPGLKIRQKLLEVLDALRWFSNKLHKKERISRAEVKMLSTYITKNQEHFYRETKQLTDHIKPKSLRHISVTQVLMIREASAIMPCNSLKANPLLRLNGSSGWTKE